MGVMLISLPSSGTDWFSGLYGEFSDIPNGKYYREFFNPHCNAKYAKRLRDAFGSEDEGDVGKIAAPWRSLPTEEVVKDTWGKEGFVFTKELWIQFKMDFFVERFKCFVLVRPLEMTLPPVRNVAFGWGKAMYASLKKNRDSVGEDIARMISAAEAYEGDWRACVVAGYYISSWKMLDDACRFGLRVVRYDHLISGTESDVAFEVKGLPRMINPAGFAKKVCETRRNSRRNFTQMGAEGVLRALAEASGGRHRSVIMPEELPGDVGLDRPVVGSRNQGFLGEIHGGKR